MATVLKVYEFIKIWWKILVGIIVLFLTFVLMKQLGIPLSGIIQLVRNFLKPSGNDPQKSEKISESTIEIKEADSKNTGAQRLSERAINNIDELLNEIQNRK